VTYIVGKDGERVVAIALSRLDLTQAPTCKATEKTPLNKVVRLKIQAAQKIDDGKKGKSTKP
jgi:hypothetical protein